MAVPANDIVTDIGTSTCPAWVWDTASQVSRKLSDGPLAAGLVDETTERMAITGQID
jgi:hypothetical protein